MKTAKSIIKSSRPPRRELSFKASIQRRLVIRLVVVGSLIAIILSATVFFLEFQRLGQTVNLRAAEIVSRFNDDIKNLIDDPASPDKVQLGIKLKMLSIIGKLNQAMGYIIFSGIYDLQGNSIVIQKDDRCDYMDEVEKVMNSQNLKLSERLKTIYKIEFIQGAPHIFLSYPLSNSSGKQTAVLSGIFALSPDAKKEVVGRIVRTAFETFCIVLITTLILYPTIVTLINRLSKLADTLLESNIETLQVLGSAIAKRDSDTDIHNYRVTIYSVTLAEARALKHKEIQTLIKGAFLHDIGKIGISDKILLKPGKLTKAERKVMRDHVRHGIDIVERSDWLRDAIDVVGYHHEQYAGDGYPYGLKGDLIPITARIFAIADNFDALTSSRPYKDPMSFEDAMQIMNDGRGTHFDPVLFDTFDTIAKLLYDRVANASDEDLRIRLESITRQYFAKQDQGP